MKSYEVQTIGNSRGNPRFYKQGKKLALAGFVPGTRFDAEIHSEEGLVVLKINSEGSRMVSRKVSGESEIPVIDINSAQYLAIFEGMDQIRVIVEDGKIVLTALATEVRRMERLNRIKNKLESGQSLSVGSTSHGAGILSHAFHYGLKEKGIETKLTFANDIDTEYLEQSQEHNPVFDENTIMISAPLQEFAFDTQALAKIGKVELLEAGLPCTAASVAGRAKKHLEKPEDDKNVGHLIVGFLSLINHTNPAIVLLENVTQYMSTASYAIYKTQMNDFGYDIKEAVLEGQQFGALENRRRMCSIAVTHGMEFDFSMVEYPEKIVRTVGEILDPIGANDPVWSEMAYLKTKEIRDKSEGKGFKRQEINAEATSIPTITRGYQKRRSTDPMLVNPENPNLLRLFSVKEHCKIKGVPELLLANVSATKGHQMLGQSVCYKMIQCVGGAVGHMLTMWKGAGYCFSKKLAVMEVEVAEKSVAPYQMDLLAA
jgi:DNA (cytosine-5)-methyltransferase 1